MKVLGIITARGGSKGIPRKNLVKVAGKPLLAYTTEVALKSQLSRVIVSTDDQEIAETALSLGVDVPFLRPAELARDETPTLPVLQDVVKRLSANGENYDAVFTLQPTNPLRIVDDINGAIDVMSNTSCDSVIGFTDVGERHPSRMKSIESSGYVVDPPFAEILEGQRRQELPPLFLRDGSVYLTRIDVLNYQNSIKGRFCQAWIIPRERALNIDEPLDLYLFEQLLLLKPDNFPGKSASQG